MKLRMHLASDDGQTMAEYGAVLAVMTALIVVIAALATAFTGGLGAIADLLS